MVQYRVCPSVDPEVSILQSTTMMVRSDHVFNGSNGKLESVVKKRLEIARFKSECECQ